MVLEWKIAERNPAGVEWGKDGHRLGEVAQKGARLPQVHEFSMAPGL